MLLPCESRSLSYSQTGIWPSTCVSPKPEHLNPPRGKTSSGPKVITGTAAGNTVTVLDWFKAWHDVAAGFLLGSLCFELWDKSICGFAFRANTASASLEIPPHQIAAKLRKYIKFHPSQTGQRFKFSWIVESFRIMSSLFGIHSLTLSSPMSHHFLGAFLDLTNNQFIILLMSSLHIPKCFPTIPSIFL